MDPLNFLRIGALGMGGIAIPQLLRAETASGLRSGPEGGDHIYRQVDRPTRTPFDLKMEAPEIRGEFKPIPTNVPGTQDLRIAAAAREDHRPVHLSSAPSRRRGRPIPDFMCARPDAERETSLSGVANDRRHGIPGARSCRSAVPAFVGLEPRMQHRPYNAATAGYAGVSHDAFGPAADANYGPSMASPRIA